MVKLYDFSSYWQSNDLTRDGCFIVRIAFTKSPTFGNLVFIDSPVSLLNRSPSSEYFIEYTSLEVQNG